MGKDDNGCTAEAVEDKIVYTVNNGMNADVREDNKLSNWSKLDMKDNMDVNRKATEECMNQR